jgi:hypothetical protein
VKKILARAMELDARTAKNIERLREYADRVEFLEACEVALIEVTQAVADAAGAENVDTGVTAMAKTVLAICVRRGILVQNGDAQENPQAEGPQRRTAEET